MRTIAEVRVYYTNKEMTKVEVGKNGVTGIEQVDIRTMVEEVNEVVRPIKIRSG